MPISKISSKYQVVIPKQLRKQLQIKPGQNVSISLDKDKNIVISTASAWDNLVADFGGKGYWGVDPTADVRKQRDQWDD